LTPRGLFSTEPARGEGHDGCVDAVAILLSAATFAALLALVAALDRI
jgi:hypothetical protein